MMTFVRHGAAALLVALTATTMTPAEAKNAALSTPSLTTAIDQEIGKVLEQENVPASPRADDAEFLRRAYLDIVGVIPTAEEATRFSEDSDPDKRAKLIDRLLEDPRYGRRMADIWEAKLILKTSDLRRLDTKPLIQWLTQKFNDNTPWDKLTHEMLTAEGKQDKNPAVTLFLGNPTIDQITDSVTRQFLGVQLQCAQCHDHPFTSYKQDEYWGLAMFFMKVRPERVRGKNTGSPGVSEISIQPAKKGKKQKGIKLPISAKNVRPKFFQGDEPKLDGAKPYRPVFAEWLTSPENPFFARAMVNRTWAHFFARGLINPIDDMHELRDPSHPELLRTLTEGFKASGFDIKELIRAICNSETYQRTSKPIKGNEEADAELYARMPIKVLSPHQLYDSVEQISEQGRKLAATSKADAKKKAQQKKKKNNNPRATPRDNFVDFFKYDPYADPTEYLAGIPQALRMLNAREHQDYGYVRLLMSQEKKPEAILDQLYLSTLSRRPRAEEKQFLLGRIDASNARASYNDILWALLNCSEFRTNH